MKINLAMIVRNEERCIRRCLEAALPYVDDIIIVDTGSEDQTVDILKEFAKELAETTSETEHHLYLEHFTWEDDFSAARNFSLDLSEKRGAEINLVLDADEYLRPVPDGYGVLRTQAERVSQTYGSRWKGNLVRFDQYREDGELEIARTGTARLLPKGIRYTGIVHEQTPGNLPVIDTILTADHDGYLQDGKGERDLALLLKQLEKDPENPYTNAQLGITLRNMQRPGEALPYFDRFWQYWYPYLQEKDNQNDVLPDYVCLAGVSYLYALCDVGTEDALDLAMQTAEEMEPCFEKIADYWFCLGTLYMQRILENTEKYIDDLPMIEKCYLICLQIGENSSPVSVEGVGSYKAAYNLGTWYEVSGQTERAAQYYQMAADLGYSKARERLKALGDEAVKTEKRS